MRMVRARAKGEVEDEGGRLRVEEENEILCMGGSEVT